LTSTICHPEVDGAIGRQRELTLLGAVEHQSHHIWGDRQEGADPARRIAQAERGRAVRAHAPRAARRPVRVDQHDLLDAQRARCQVLQRGLGPAGGWNGPAERQRGQDRG